MKLIFTLITLAILAAHQVITSHAEPGLNFIPIVFCENLNYDIVVIYNPTSNNMTVVENGIEYIAPAVHENKAEGTNLSASYHINNVLQTSVTLTLLGSYQGERSFAASLAVQKRDRSPEALQNSEATVSLSCIWNTLGDMEAQIAQSTF